jgi:hypothetical protein
MHTSGQIAEGQQLSTPPTAKEFREWINELANRNPEPKIASRGGSESWPIFPEDFDFDEQKRVRTRLLSLPPLEGNDLWPILCEHRSDARYCLTYINRYGYTENASIGWMCREMTRGDLLFAYRQYSKRIPGTETEGQDNALWEPSVEDGFLGKEWFAARKGRQLWELQIEMCEWAIAKAPALEKLSEKGRGEFVQKVTAEIERLKKTREPAVLRTRFHGEGYGIVNRERAQSFREKYSKYVPNEK